MVSQHLAPHNTLGTVTKRRQPSQADVIETTCLGQATWPGNSPTARTPRRRPVLTGPNRGRGLPAASDRIWRDDPW